MQPCSLLKEEKEMPSFLSPAIVAAELDITTTVLLLCVVLVSVDVHVSSSLIVSNSKPNSLALLFPD
jgi:hypothetical protein